MAHWPRWLDDTTVDSSAMAIAYSAWYKRQEPQPSLLPMFIHQAGPEREYMLASVQDPGTYEVQCRVPACWRCRTGKGGFAFRWYSRDWYDEYVRWARPGAWTQVGPKVVGEPEPEPAGTMARQIPPYSQ